MAVTQSGNLVCYAGKYCLAVAYGGGGFAFVLPAGVDAFGTGTGTGVLSVAKSRKDIQRQ